MDLEIRSLETTELFDSHQQNTLSTHDPEAYLSGDNEDDAPFTTGEESDIHAAESGVIESIYNDDKAALLAHSKRLLERASEPWDRSITAKLLHLCCAFDSAECAAALLDGELGAVPLVNEIDEAGKSPLHTAAEYHAARCAELLLRKRARTDLRTKDGCAQVALEMSLSSARMDVVWNPDDYTIEDLVVLLGEKDLTTIILISEKTKEVAEIACAKAVEGRIVALAALLVVAAENINETTLELLDVDSGGSKEKTTVYECVVREALSLSPETTSSSLGTANDTSSSEKRKFLLSEIELLQLFGVVSHCRCADKKVKSSGLLLRAVQAGDETVVALLLKSSIDIDEADAEGNSALHYSVKASRTPSAREIKILILLLKYGARVSQKNKLGLTALHVAAGNGHLKALQILLLEDPDGINYKTEMKETPLFFAAKNDHMDCAELLLRWGANSEVLNLLRQRPIDLAKSQDMRFMLNPTNIGLMKRNFPSQQKLATWSLEDEIFMGNYGTALSMTNEETAASERTCLSTTTEICKYFSSPHGCVRGAKCFYSHSEEPDRNTKQGNHRNRSPTAIELNKKIFVGGLPISLNSDSLRKYFEDNFGPVQDAKVLETHIGNQTQSRGFGFVTFKDEKPVSAAVQAHYVTIMDKQVEIKSMLPRWLLENESQKPSAQPNNLEKSDKLQTQAQLPRKNSVEEGKPQQRHWLNNILSGLSPTCSTKAQAYMASEGEKMPTWLTIFTKWLPGFLQILSKHAREGEYALSSLKGDFRAKFGLELDHVSLGYPKLSDFMKRFSDLCSIKIVPTGRGSPNHMVLVPKSTLQQKQRRMLTTRPIVDEGDNFSIDSKSTIEERTSVSSRNPGFDCDRNEKQNSSTWFSLVDTPQDDLSRDTQPKLLELLQQNPLFHIRPWLQNEHNTAKVNSKNETAGCLEEANGNNPRRQLQHPVLEAFSRSRKNSSVYFLREFDFYRNYYASVKEGKCFACNEQEVLWANFPCQHLLWCIDCKMQASIAAGSLGHKCVVCDMEVQKLDLLSCYDYRQLVDQYIFHEEFPPLDHNQIPSPSTKKTSPLVGS